MLGKILERAIDRATADEELVSLAEQFQQDQSDIHTRHFGSQLEAISKELSDAVGVFTRDRSIKVSPLHVDAKPPKVQFSGSVIDHQTETRADRQGHGFQPMTGSAPAPVRELVKHATRYSSRWFTPS